MNRKTGEQSVSEKLDKAREYEKNRQNEEFIFGWMKARVK